MTTLSTPQERSACSLRPGIHDQGWFFARPQKFGRMFGKRKSRDQIVFPPGFLYGQVQHGSMPEMHAIEHSDRQPNRTSLALSEFGKRTMDRGRDHNAWVGTA